MYFHYKILFHEQWKLILYFSKVCCGEKKNFKIYFKDYHEMPLLGFR